MTFTINNRVTLNLAGFLLLLSMPVSAMLAAVLLLVENIVGSYNEVGFIHLLPHPLYVAANLLGAVAAFACFGLYPLMWVYLLGISKERTTVRVLWGILMIFTLIIGAVIYAFKVALFDVKRQTVAT